MLELLSKNHKVWIAMVISMGCNEAIAEDFVQEMYIRIDRYVKDGKTIMYNDDEVNRFYIYVTLRNLYIDYYNELKKFEVVNYDDVYDYLSNNLIDLGDLYEDDKDQATDKLNDNISEYINTLTIFEQKLIHLIYKEGLSLRKIAEGSGIGISSIYNSVKICKKKLIDNFGEDLEDYFNSDYNHI